MEQSSAHASESRFIQHHYDDAKHQFDAGKLGMWFFLVQEILFFSGLFVAYIVYRSFHPEIYAYAKISDLRALNHPGVGILNPASPARPLPPSPISA